MNALVVGECFPADHLDNGSLWTYSASSAGWLDIPVRQHVVRDGDWNGRVDLAYVSEMIFIEGDSRRWHTGSLWGSDQRRQNKLVSLGWLPLRFTYDDVEQRPGFICGSIARTLAERRLAAPNLAPL